MTADVLPGQILTEVMGCAKSIAFSVVQAPRAGWKLSATVRSPCDVVGLPYSSRRAMIRGSTSPTGITVSPSIASRPLIIVAGASGDAMTVMARVALPCDDVHIRLTFPTALG